MSDKSVRVRIFLAIFTTIILWASAFVGIRAAIKEYPPLHLAAFRYIIASIILIPVACIKKIKLPKSKDLILFFLTGFFGFTLYNYSLNYGEKMVTSGSACFIVNGGNLITAILAASLLKEKIFAATWLGMFISLIGVGIISFGEAGITIGRNIGPLLILLAAFAQSMYFILQKSLLSRYSSLELVCYSIWIGTIAMLPMSGSLDQTILLSSIQSTSAVIYLGIFPAVIAYFCWAYVLSKLEASKAAIFLYLVPIVTMIIGYLWLEEIPPIASILGGFITIGGIIIAKYWGTIEQKLKANKSAPKGTNWASISR